MSPRLTLAALVASAALVGCQRRVDAPAPVSRYEILEAAEPTPEHLRGTIGEFVVPFGVVPQVISGYGLVVNLDNTGRDDGIPTPVRDRISETAARRGVASQQTGGVFSALSPAALLADPRTAVVYVEGYVPPAARKGQRIDIAVRALETNTTPSLARGSLWLTELHTGVVGPGRPGEPVNKVAVARGPLLLNPVHALLAPEAASRDPAAVASLRNGIIPDGGVIEFERPIVLRLRQPSYRLARQIEQRINLHFGSPVARAEDEARVELRLPGEGDFAPRGADDWQKFLGVAMSLYFDGTNPDVAARRAETLARAAEASAGDDDALLAISRAFEGLGQNGLPALVPLYRHADPSVAFYATRAAAHLKQPFAQEQLRGIAGDPRSPYNVAAATELGRVPPSVMTRRLTRDLLHARNAGNDAVRIAAYESLLRLGLGQTGIEERLVNDNFVLHLAPGDGTPIVYARRTGRPTLAIIGAVRPADEAPRVRAPMLASLFGDRLTISRNDGDEVVRLFQREQRPDAVDARPNGFADVRSLPDLRELVARLGGERVPGERAIRLTYGDVVAVLKELSDRRDLVAGRSGEQVVSVRLQDLVDFGEPGDVAPPVPGLERRRLGADADARAAASD